MDWTYHDNKLRELRQIYNKISKQTQNKLQTIFDTFKFSFDTLYNIADEKTKERVNTIIEEYKDQGLLAGYFGVLANNIYKRTRVKNSEILELLIYGAYIEEQNKLQEQEQELMYQVVSYYYEQGQQEVLNTRPKRKRKKPLPLLTLGMFKALLEQANVTGWSWQQYLDITTKYNAEQIYKQAIINIQQGVENNISDIIYQNIIAKQQNAKLCINGDKISGAMDIELIGLDNLAKLEGIKSVDNEATVRFVAEKDEKTTEMCEGLDNKVFFVDKENVFDRWYGETKNDLRVERIRCNGLVLGLNLPPINHHFHWCRSTITYQSDKTADEIRNNYGGSR